MYECMYLCRYKDKCYKENNTRAETITLFMISRVLFKVNDQVRTLEWFYLFIDLKCQNSSYCFWDFMQ